MVTILKIPYKATITLQKKDLSLSDAFGIWLKTIVHLEHPTIQRLRKTNYSKCLVTCLNTRKEMIFNNPAMLAAVYLDPRFRSQILRDENKVQQALHVIRNLHLRIANLRPDTGANCSNDSSGLNINIDFDDTGLLDKYLSGEISSTDSQSSGMTIDTEIDSFNPEPIPSDSSVKSFWKSEKLKHPRLYEVATVLNADPPTECQIERDFSILEFVITQRRLQLSSDTLEAILNINLNSDLFSRIKAEELKKIEDRNDDSM